MADIKQIIRKAKRDARRARRGGNQSSSRSSIIRRAKRDIRRGERIARRKASETSVQDIAEKFDGGGKVPEDGAEDTLKRAEEKAYQAPAIGGYQLSPETRPERQERIVTGQESVADDEMESLVMGDFGGGILDDDGGGMAGGSLLGTGSEESDADEDPLQFESDLLGVGGDDNGGLL